MNATLANSSIVARCAVLCRFGALSGGAQTTADFRQQSSAAFFENCTITVRSDAGGHGGDDGGGAAAVSVGLPKYNSNVPLAKIILVGVLLSHVSILDVRCRFSIRVHSVMFQRSSKSPSSKKNTNRGIRASAGTKAVFQHCQPS